MNIAEFESEVQSAKTDCLEAMEGAFDDAIKALEAAHSEFQRRVSMAKAQLMGEPVSDSSALNPGHAAWRRKMDDLAGLVDCRADGTTKFDRPCNPD